MLYMLRLPVELMTYMRWKLGWERQRLNQTWHGLGCSGQGSRRPWRRAWMACLGVDRVRSSFRFRSRCVTTVHSNITSMPSVNSE